MTKKNVFAILAVVAAIVILVVMLGFSDVQRVIKTTKSNWSGGLNRVVNVYDYNGGLIATYHGKIDVETNDTKVLFDLDGKRYIYYNCLVEVIEVDE